MSRSGGPSRVRGSGLDVAASLLRLVLHLAHLQMVRILLYRLYSCETMPAKETGKVIIHQRSGSMVNERCKPRNYCLLPLPLTMDDRLDRRHLGRIGERVDLEIWMCTQC